MVELAPPLASTVDPMMPPAPPFVHSDRSSSRPLSESSDNSDLRRCSTALSLKSDNKPGSNRPSRPSSEIRELDAAKRHSANVPLQTITVNLVEYASLAGKHHSVLSPSTANSTPVPPPNSSSKSVGFERPAGLATRTVSTSSIKETQEEGRQEPPSGEAQAT
jgi:hypothetical protein